MTDGAIECVYNYPQGIDIFRGLATEFDVLIRGDHSFLSWPYGVPDDRVAQAAIGVYPSSGTGLRRAHPAGASGTAQCGGPQDHEEISARLVPDIPWIARTSTSTRCISSQR